MTPQCIRLTEFTDPGSSVLDAAELAACVMRVMEPGMRCWVELDFSGIQGVSAAFAQAFLRQLERDLPDLWLVPKHYGPSTQELVAPLILRLERLRVKVWLAGCERYSTGFDTRN